MIAFSLFRPYVLNLIAVKIQYKGWRFLCQEEYFFVPDQDSGRKGGTVMYHG